MSSAPSWSFKGIDPKVREAAREAAARQGMTLAEYLNQALQDQQAAEPPALPQPTTTRLRSARLGVHPYDQDDDDWRVSSPASARGEAQRLAQRMDAIERRTQLALAGLDRAVNTIDRSVFGLSARIDDAEVVASEAADRVAQALEHFRIAGDTLSGREEIQQARDEFDEARMRLEAQAAAAENVAKKAEATAQFLAEEMENRDAILSQQLEALSARSREQLEQSLTMARDTAREAAREAALASAEALSELRHLHETLSKRVEDNEAASEAALAEARQARQSVVEEVVRLESEIGARMAETERLKSDHAALLSRIEKTESSSREATAGLRQAAGAAIADLRNAQLGLAARLKHVEDGAGASDIAEMRAQQEAMAARLGKLEAPAQSPVDAALAAFEKRIGDIAEQVSNAPSFASKVEELTQARFGAVDDSLMRLAARLAETESTANTAIRTLEETVSGLSAKVDSRAASEETEKLRAMLEQRLDDMAQSVTQMVGEARSELADQVQAAIGDQDAAGLEEALADVNRRLAAAERRQAQTIEAISIEIKRMSETVDRRLRAVETKPEAEEGGGEGVRAEVAQLKSTLEQRFEEIERREAAGFDRMGIEIGRLSERLEDRVGEVENRSAQAIEQVGEQVARMAERFNQRHDMLARELGERMLDSEERAGGRVSEAINSIMQRLSEVEDRAADAVAPVQKAVSGVAARLDSIENRTAEAEPEDDLKPEPIIRGSAPLSFISPLDEDDDDDLIGDADMAPAPRASAPAHVAPLDAAQPMRAGPLPLRTPAAEAPAQKPTFTLDDPESDIYFADAEEEHYATPAPQKINETVSASEDDDLLLQPEFVSDADAFAPPPPEDDDPFWTPPSEAPAAATSVASDLFEPDAEAGPARPKNEYLNAARKAAQAQAASKPNGKAKKDEPKKDAAAPEAYSLRGSSRVVLWGAASAIALLIAGGAWYWNEQQQAGEPGPGPAPSEPEPAAASLTDHVEPPVQPYEESDPFGAPIEDGADPTLADPAIQGGAEGSPVEPATAGAPMAALEGTPERTALVAGPLPPRAVSLEQAARNGDAVAQYELGLQRLSGGRADDGVGLLRRAAERGLAMAQYRLGKLYERGEGVQADLNQARQWTERAAAGGNRRAMHDLGVYFARGEGAPLDEAAAFRWFRQAAELGVADSQYNLGVLYQQGRGVGASTAEAMFWFLVAARQGDSDAAGRAAALEPSLSAAQVAQARARAEAFRPRAASAQANGQFGPRAWANDAVSQAGRSGGA